MLNSREQLAGVRYQIDGDKGAPQFWLVRSGMLLNIFNGEEGGKGVDCIILFEYLLFFFMFISKIK